MAVSVFLKNDKNFVTYLSLDEGYKELKNASCGDGDVMSEKAQIDNNFSPLLSVIAKRHRFFFFTWKPESLLH